jgi:hypothetical protein
MFPGKLAILWIDMVAGYQILEALSHKPYGPYFLLVTPTELVQ